MPTYEYQCRNCGVSVEMSREIDERDEPMLCTCKYEMIRIYSAPAIKFNGTGFYSTGG